MRLQAHGGPAAGGSRGGDVGPEYKRAGELPPAQKAIRGHGGQQPVTRGSLRVNGPTIGSGHAPEEAWREGRASALVRSGSVDRDGLERHGTAAGDAVHRDLLDGIGGHLPEEQLRPAAHVDVDVDCLAEVVGELDRRRSVRVDRRGCRTHLDLPRSAGGRGGQRDGDERESQWDDHDVNPRAGRKDAARWEARVQITCEVQLG